MPIGWKSRLVAAAAGLALAGALVAAAAPRGAKRAKATGKVRTYYIAADEVVWDYAPHGRDMLTNQPFDKMEREFTVSGPHRIGSKYLKAVYREYTDATFTHLKPRPPEQQYLGILGPIVHAEVGDTVKIVFRNNGSRPYSIHPHGVFYGKDSEGMAYNDGATAADRLGDAVAPGTTYTYTWHVPERAGPGPNDPSSVVWLYHSHVNEGKDVNSGLIGALVVTRRGMARADGTPKDVNREFAALFMMFNENDSWYLRHNVDTYTSDPKGVNVADLNPIDVTGVFSLIGSGFADSNIKSTINGYLFANGPTMEMRKGERVRWYLVTLGFGFNFHTPHWHGNVVTMNGHRTDVLSISPAQMLTADMVPDNPGIWLFHCHVSDHMHMGMTALYEVKP
jgi:FtsP/CotA-like multicopper oxidase with cupredoxin domain